MLRDDRSATEISKRIEPMRLRNEYDPDAGWYRWIPAKEWEDCQRLLMQRRRWEAGVQAALNEGRPPTEESIAAWAKVEPRTVQRWRHGG
jgi:hypothetical protein